MKSAKWIRDVLLKAGDSSRGHGFPGAAVPRGLGI